MTHTGSAPTHPGGQRYVSRDDAKGPPDLFAEHDEDGAPRPGTLAVGWDMSFGCQINVAPNCDGDLQVSVHVSDRAQRDCVATRAITPNDHEQVPGTTRAPTDAAHVESFRLALAAATRRYPGAPARAVTLYAEGWADGHLAGGQPSAPETPGAGAADTTERQLLRDHQPILDPQGFRVTCAACGLKFRSPTRFGEHQHDLLRQNRSTPNPSTAATASLEVNHV